jgi:hypothetical protein
MKTREKILLAILAILLIAWAVLAWIFIHEENKVKEYSTYCMDRVRHELWEQLENIHMTDAFCSEWTCVYIWGTTYEWVDYAYACKVYNKENVELDIEPLYPEEEPVVEEDISNAKMRIVEWQTEEEVQAMVEEACGNMWWTWADGSCMLEDGSYVNF